MKFELRPVFVIQDPDTGLFLGWELYGVKSLKDAGREYSWESARETADANGWDDAQIHKFYERVLASDNQVCAERG